MKPAEEVAREWCAKNMDSWSDWTIDALTALLRSRELEARREGWVAATEEVIAMLNRDPESRGWESLIRGLRDPIRTLPEDKEPPR